MPTERWEAIFGKADPTKFRKAKKAQDAAKKKRNNEVASTSAGVAVHGDDLYRGFDRGLGCNVRGRTHRRELMKRVGEQSGRGPLREAG